MQLREDHGGAAGWPPPPLLPSLPAGREVLGFAPPSLVASVGRCWAEGAPRAAGVSLAGPVGAVDVGGPLLLLVGAAQEAHSGAPSQLLKWWWLPRRTLDRSLGFPASSHDISRHRARAKIHFAPAPLLTSPSLPCLVAMDREWHDRPRSGKRGFDEVRRGGDHHRDGDLRYRLDREQEAVRRGQRERDDEQDRRREEGR